MILSGAKRQEATQHIGESLTILAVPNLPAIYCTIYSTERAAYRKPKLKNFPRGGPVLVLVGARERQELIIILLLAELAS